MSSLPTAEGRLILLSGGATDLARSLSDRLAGLGLAPVAVERCADLELEPHASDTVILADAAASACWLAEHRANGGRAVVLAVAEGSAAAAMLRAGADAVAAPDASDRALLTLVQTVQRWRAPRSCAAEAAESRPGAGAAERLKLTPTEQKILTLLERRPGRVVTRELIVDCLYVGQDAPQKSTVDVFMSGLRRKLAGSGGRIRIETVRGAGFRLAEA